MSMHRLNRLMRASQCCLFAPSLLYPTSSFSSTRTTCQRFLTVVGQVEGALTERSIEDTRNKQRITDVNNASSKHEPNQVNAGSIPADIKENDLCHTEAERQQTSDEMKLETSDEENDRRTPNSIPENVPKMECLLTERSMPNTKSLKWTAEGSNPSSKPDLTSVNAGSVPAVNGTKPEPTSKALAKETFGEDKATEDDPFYWPLTKARSLEISKHMLALYSNLLPSEQDKNRLNSFVSGVRNCFQQKYGNKVDIQVFGSAASDLWMGSDSDVDLSLVFCDSKVPKMLEVTVFGMARALAKGEYNGIRPISQASVPIVKFLDPRTNISSDVNIMNRLGIKNTDMIREYCNFDERVKPFVYLVKWFVKRRNLNNPARDGTPSSYCHVMMALHYLQICTPPILPSFQQIAKNQGRTDWVKVSRGEYAMGLRKLTAAPGRNVAQWSNCAYSDDLHCMEEMGFQPDKSSTLAELLYGFFMHYGYDFDFKNEVVSLRLGRRASKTELCFDTDALAVEDPFLLWKNLLATANDKTRHRLQKEYRYAAYLLSTQPPAEALEKIMAPIEFYN